MKAILNAPPLGQDISMTPIVGQETMCPSLNTRWCPTPEQLMILEELYRRGLKTPNAAQIQRITAQLSMYGKIQGKNVFYWFQNHKARDRQKLRKKLASQQHHLIYPVDHQTHHPLHYFHHQLQASPHFQPFPQTLFHAQAPPAEDMMNPIPKDCLIGSYGHDSTMIMGVGPTVFPCCTINKPLQTLELFPLKSPTATTDNQSSTS